MNRNITPRPIKAQGARDSHGRIFEDGAGSLYVHMHREAGLAHRHYVLTPWQVRLLGIFTARPLLVVYLVAIASWGWMAGQAARVPLLRSEITALTADAQRLDTLTATLAELQTRYDQVQRLLSVANAGASSATRTPARTPAKSASGILPKAATLPVIIPRNPADSADSTKRPVNDSTRRPIGAP